jgi:hypothetical protein
VVDDAALDGVVQVGGAGVLGVRGDLALGEPAQQPGAQVVGAEDVFSAWACSARPRIEGHGSTTWLV